MEALIAEAESASHAQDWTVSAIMGGCCRIKFCSLPFHIVLLVAIDGKERKRHDDGHSFPCPAWNGPIALFHESLFGHINTLELHKILDIRYHD